MTEVMVLLRRFVIQYVTSSLLPVSPQGLGSFIFLQKITGKVNLMWMAMSSYVTLACCKMRAAGRISVFMPSDVII